MLLGLVGVLALVTGLQFFVPGLPIVILAPELDYVSNAAGMVIAGAVALIAWIRSRETDEPDAPYQASAFTVLFVGGALTTLLLVSDRTADAGFARTAPGQAPLYLWTAQRLLAALLLLIGAAAALRRSAQRTRRAGLVVVAPSVALLAIDSGLLVGQSRLPVLVGPDDMAKVTTATDVLNPGMLSTPLAVTQLALAGLFLAAIVAYFLVYRREGGRRAYVAYLCAALVMAAFSQVHFAMVPGPYTGLFTSGDVFRLAFYVLLGLGVAAGWRQDLHDLRTANDDLQRLRAGEANRIALEERARMARDIHDGLVQELWLARLTQGQLVRQLEEDVQLTAAVSATARRVDSMLDEALAEARQAVVTLQPQPSDGFGGLFAQFVEDYAQRFGIEVECVVPPEPIRVGPQQQGEILRICREALTNARKHADATLVRVALDPRPDGLRLTVSDDGRGFDPSAMRSGFGVRSMRERAARLGGSLQIDTTPRDGTRVTLDVPGEGR
jgi:signal transduction histidine kinase